MASVVRMHLMLPHQMHGLTRPEPVDTGAGNGKARPWMAVLGNLKTDFLGALRSAAVDPADVDVVINTHLHFDHVGWNTMRDGDAWVPTFPNTRYLMPEADYRHFHPDGAAQRALPQTEDERSLREHVRTVFADSVSPVEEQIELWSDDYQLCESVHLRPAPGHTPGSSVVWLDAGGLEGTIRGLRRLLGRRRCPTIAESCTPRSPRLRPAGAQHRWPRSG
jgi:glyoxylase-like metal-dependent hydrolase (beta-lactamase superfamily II)